MKTQQEIKRKTVFRLIITVFFAPKLFPYNIDYLSKYARIGKNRIKIIKSINSNKSLTQ